MRRFCRATSSSRPDPSMEDPETSVPVRIARGASDELCGIGSWLEALRLRHPRMKLVVDAPVAAMQAPRDAKYVVVHMPHVTM